MFGLFLFRNSCFSVSLFFKHVFHMLEALVGSFPTICIYLTFDEFNKGGCAVPISDESKSNILNQLWKNSICFRRWPSPRDSRQEDKRSTCSFSPGLMVNGRFVGLLEKRMNEKLTFCSSVVNMFPAWLPAAAGQLCDVTKDRWVLQFWTRNDCLTSSRSSSGFTAGGPRMPS